jgi:hypothetical protein
MARCACTTWGEIGGVCVIPSGSCIEIMSWKGFNSGIKGHIGLARYWRVFIGRNYIHDIPALGHCCFRHSQNTFNIRLGVGGRVPPNLKYDIFSSRPLHNSRMSHQFRRYWSASVLLGRKCICNIVHKSVLNPKLTDKGKTQFRFFMPATWNSAPSNSHHDHQGLHKLDGDLIW